MILRNIVYVSHFLLFSSWILLLQLQLHFSLSTQMKLSTLILKYHIQKCSISGTKKTLKCLQRRISSVLINEPSQSLISIFFLIQQKFKSVKSHIRSLSWKLSMDVIPVKLLIKYEHWQISYTAQILEIHICDWKSKSEELSEQVLRRPKYEYPKHSKEEIEGLVSGRVDGVEEVDVGVVVCGVLKWGCSAHEG